jgi:outer membrane protein OmpA-like peptidoglycan-associated protein
MMPTSPLLVLLLVSWSAEAAERSLDTQLVQPVLMPGALVGLDTPRAPDEPAFIGGAAWQLEHLPLEYFENTLPAGAAIASRNTLHLAGGYPIGGRVMLGGRWSAALMDPGDEPSVAPLRQVAAGDLGLFGRVAMLQGERFAFGPRLELWLPTGTDESWVSERAARYAPSLLAQLDLGPARLHAGAGLMVRPELDTERDFELGSEATFQLGAAVVVSDGWTGLLEASSRHGLADFMQPGAENPIELKAGARYAPGLLAVDMVGGTALSHGYGTADFRLLVSISRLAPRSRPEPEPAPVVVEIPPPRAVVAIAEELPDQRPEVSWEKDELAQVHRGRIVIREPLQFELDTAVLLPESVPTLEAVADIMTEYPQIELLVIEGHASEEGSDRHNYDLSNLRAVAVFEALLSAGVRPQRLSYRALGETAPVAPGEDEASLARSRRVEFHIVKVRDYLDVAPDYGGDLITLPWSGERIPEPPAGSSLLSADAHPILLEEAYVNKPAPAESVPDEQIFRQDFDEEEATEGERP